MTRYARSRPPRTLRALFVLATVIVLALAACAGLGGERELAVERPDAGRDSAAESGTTAEKPGGSGGVAESGAGTASTAESPEAPKSAELRGPAAELEGKGEAEPEYLAEVGEAAAAPSSGERGDRFARTSAPEASGLRAGFADDNRQFNYFVDFLERYGHQIQHYAIPVEERIVFRVTDRQGNSVPNAEVLVTDTLGEKLVSGITYADGSFLFFPAEHGPVARYRLRASYNQQVRELEFDRGGQREIEVALPGPRGELSRIPLDILFILDTTGSMGEEIERLKTTIEIINLNLSSLSTRPRVRFGMVLYKDRRDEYVTRVVPFTEDLPRFQEALEGVSAGGGGDTPEDLQSALEEAMGLSWNRDGVRLAFVITDAPPHLDYVGYTYVEAAREAKSRGIKIFSVGTGGLDLMGEYVLRQVSQYTSAKYIFLTYGERGESEGGAPGSVSHHTGSNYETDKLEAIIIRLAKEELAHLTKQPLKEEEEFFQANRVESETREQTLRKLFGLAVSQLADYSSIRLHPGTSAAVLPMSTAQPAAALNAEYFTEQLILSLGEKGAGGDLFQLVERRDLQQILGELELQLSDLSDTEAEATGAAQVGALVGAEVLILGKMYAKKDEFELFLKLIRVETGEVLSVTKSVIDRRLGLET